MSKFVGKFRKNKDYNDDYNYAKNHLHSKRRRDEQAEIKRLKYYEDESSLSYEETEEDFNYTRF